MLLQTLYFNQNVENFVIANILCELHFSLMNEKSPDIKEKRRRINVSQWSYYLSLSLDGTFPNVFHTH